jgi:hypothetical protein
MTVFIVTVYMQNYTLTSKQSNKHTLIVVKCLQLSTNNIEVLLKLCADVKNSTLLQDCGESYNIIDINHSIDLVMIERTEST